MTIKADDVFIYPTDTVWGIGCSLYSELGILKIAEIKKTSKDKPLSIMFSSVDDVYSAFHFPEEVSKIWLQDFFKLETTLILPLKAAVIKFPRWSTAESSYISVRCLENDLMKKIYQETRAPFFTTSLNLSGEAPITSVEKAREFQKLFASDAFLFEENDSRDLSGVASSIIILEENLNFEIKREGRRLADVKNHLIKLFQR